MLRWFAPVLGLALAFSVVGCQDSKMSKADNGDTMMTSTDVCPTCPGVQKATADGKCEKCGAVVDACPHCPGVQVATADGKCPTCGARLGK